MVFPLIYVVVSMVLVSNCIVNMCQESSYSDKDNGNYGISDYEITLQ